MCPDIYADRVHIYVSGRVGPVTTVSRLELASRSRQLHHLLASLSLCDGCTQPLALVIAGEEANTVEAAFSQLAVFNKRAGVSIIQGEGEEFIVDIYNIPDYIIFRTQKSDCASAKIRVSKMLRSEVQC